MDHYIVNKPWYKSKRFFAMVLGIAITLINQYTGFDIDTEQILTIYFTIASYILGQSYVDGKH